MSAFGVQTNERTQLLPGQVSIDNGAGGATPVFKGVAIFVVIGFLGGTVMLVFELTLGVSVRAGGFDFLIVWIALMVVSAMFLASMYIWHRTSSLGPVRAITEVLSVRPLKGDEDVLDGGCGRGLLSLAMGKQLARVRGKGKITALDLWQSCDPSGAERLAFQGEIKAEGLEKYIQTETADALHLPFEGKTFDLVVSGLALHKIESQEDRKAALFELVRVMRGGGHIVVWDVAHCHEYMSVLDSHGSLQHHTISERILAYGKSSYVISAMKHISATV